MRHAYKIILALILFIHIGNSQQIFDEMAIVDISDKKQIKSTVVRDPNQALLVIFTQLKDLHVTSNNKIIAQKKIDRGKWHITVTPGTHRLSFQSPGFISAQKRIYFNLKQVKGIAIKVLAAEKIVDRKSGTIVIKSSPDSAKVFINDLFYGYTPYLGKLLSGLYELKVQKQGFAVYTEAIIIRPGETLPLSAELKTGVNRVVADSGAVIQAAVLDFDHGIDISQAEISMLTNRFRDKLREQNVFHVLNNKKVSALFDKMNYNIKSCSFDCAVETGKILNVHKLFFGAINRIGNTYTIKISLVDISGIKLERTIIRDRSGKMDELLEVLDEMAQDFMEVYNKDNGGIAKKWWWIGGGGAAVLGATIYLIINKNNSSTPPLSKFPDAGNIWPPK